MQEKVTSLRDIETLVAEAKERGERVVHCHGVFDLLHPGHIRHIKEAREQGDRLVVSITPDRFVNKGPGRPAFTEDLRLEQLASLSFVDHVVLNDSPDAVSVIERVKPSVYVKGEEYKKHEDDVTGKITDEAMAVESVGGEIYYTSDIVFSSSSLINRFVDEDAGRITPFTDMVKQRFSLKQMLAFVEKLSDLKVLVVGDAIIDEYQYVEPLGQSGKGVHLTAKLCDRETFLGGSLIIANHVASFAKEVTLLTAVGKNCPHLPFIKRTLKSTITPELVYLDGYPTLTKKRYVQKDGCSITKLFETYSSNETLLGESESQQVIETIKEHARAYDLVLVSDFGNGFTNPGIVEALCSQPSFLAVNTQTNSGNRGYNVISHYHRADFISLNEPELRLAAHDRYCSLESVTHDMAELLDCPLVSVSGGVRGVYLHPRYADDITVPALTSHAIDRVGAGDSYLALASMCAASGYDPLVSGFLGSIAAAIDVQIVGNREAIEKVALCKYLTRLMK